MTIFTEKDATPRKDLSGKRFGKLSVIKPIGQDKHRSVVYLCVCDCGNEKPIRGANLVKGDTVSCGCHGREMLQHSKTHDMCKTAVYAVWNSMNQRCYNPKVKSYQYYGARGITVCDEWKTSFEAFYKDMGPRPVGDYQIDRKDNNKGYGPQNCEWVTRTANANNKRSNVKITHKGESLNVSQWASKIGCLRGTLERRINNLGWSPEKAIETPVRAHK